MAELTLLLPDGALAPAGATPATLERWLARGDRLADAGNGRAATLRSCFEFIGTALPVAALTRHLDANDAAGALWLRCDPAWIVADAVTLRMLACGNMQLSIGESLELARALKPLFGDAGFALEATTPERWYLRCPPGAQLPQFADPDVVLGDDVARHMPEGGTARRWHHLLNEAQMILHQHPVNAERARRGLAPVNSVWPWGAGKLPDWVRTPYRQVRSADPIVHALARVANVAAVGLPIAWDGTGEHDPVLLDLAGMRERSALEDAWLAPIQQAIAQRAVGAVDLRFEGGERFCYRRAHRWRFWRRARTAAR